MFVTLLRQKWPKIFPKNSFKWNLLFQTDGTALFSSEKFSSGYILAGKRSIHKIHPFNYTKTKIPAYILNGSNDIRKVH